MKSGRRKIWKVLIFSFLIATIVSASVGCASGTTPPEVEWSKTFGGTNNDYGYFAQQTTDGGYIFAGCTMSYGAGNYDAWLVKTDSQGNKQWDKTFGGTGEDTATLSVQQTADGGYIFVGWTGSYGAGGDDFWLVKTDSNGNEQWNKTFGGGDFDYAYSVQQTADGGYILAGVTHSYGVGGDDMWLVKTDSNGNEQWNKTFGGPGEERAHSVQQTADCGFILAGYTKSYGAGDDDIWLVKTDSNGNEQWNKTFGGTNRELAFSVQQTADGGYVLAGLTESYGAGNYDAWLVKTDSEGKEQWDKTFGGTGYDYAHSVQQTSDGDYIFVGWTGWYGAGPYDFWLVKTDSNGNKEWDKTFGGTDDDKAYSVQQTADSGYIIAGYTRSYGAGFYDFWLIKVKGEEPAISIFDTGPSENPYPSIMGTHKGEIKPSDNIHVSKLYTYPCVGTGGHTESIKLYENDELIASGTWNGYRDDYHTITITPSVTLLAGHTYNYTIVTGSYPQIIHAKSKDVTGGTITCTEFVDANGKRYDNWIPAIRLE